MFVRKSLAFLPILFLATLAVTAPLAIASEKAKEWKPSQGAATKPAATPAAKKAAKPTASSSRAKSPITISLKSRMREGNLLVMVDNVPILNEKFNKPLFAISQTTTWDPLQVPVGKHKLTAKIVNANGKTINSGTYDLELSRKQGIELMLRVKSGKLIVEPVITTASAKQPGETPASFEE